jgi:hypothetical protein
MQSVEESKAGKITFAIEPRKFEMNTRAII